MTVRDDRGDVKQTTTGFRGPLMVQSLTSAKSKFLSLTATSLQSGQHRARTHMTHSPISTRAYTGNNTIANATFNVFIVSPNLYIVLYDTGQTRASKTQPHPT